MGRYAAAIEAVRREVALEQLTPELDEFLQLCDRMSVRSVVEIGSRFGGTLACWLKVLGAKSVIAVDLPLEGMAVWPGRTASWRSWVGPGQRLMSVAGRSEDQAIVSTVRAALSAWGLRHADMVFIDGGHTYAQVKADFEAYSPLACGMVAIHDIVPSTVLSKADCDVATFWGEAKVGREFVEISRPEEGSRGGYGIGVLLK